VWLFPDATVDDLVDAVVAAEEEGLDEVWIADEGVMRDPVVVFAAAAARTERVGLGIGITTPALRHPGAIAATVASLDELTGGRVMLGVGVGGELSLGPFGVQVERPVALIRDALRIARAVLRREDADGYTVPAHAAPARDVPLYVASRGEQINRLASREADGVFLSGLTDEGIGRVLDWARSGGAPTVALYQSARFRPTRAADPTVVEGPPEVVAERLAVLVAQHHPDTIGLALVGGDRPVAMVRDAAATFGHL
jgi:alkanesulfonate monooxygenase SsuD/methylene tetrahydromethanopterin reductase-like flavin-dependent oxidoreductase (luciferase family)